MCYDSVMMRILMGKSLNLAAAILVVAVVIAWAYSFIVQPIVEGKWLAVMAFLAACLFWAALRETARRKAESIDYSSRE